MVSSSADSKRPSQRATQSDAAGKAAASDPVNAGRTTIRLPFMTASFTRPPRSASVAAAAWTPQASIRQAADSLHVPIPRSRWALYGAAVALGALEVVEWPVALLVVAGTYLTDRATSTDNAADSPARAASDLVVPSPVEQHTGGAS